jgi:subtilisin
VRYEYLILPPAPAPWHLRILNALRALFRHPGRALMLGLLLIFLATQLNAQQGPAQVEGRAALKARVREAGYRVIVGLRPDARSRGMTAPGRSAVSDEAAEGISRTLQRKGLRVSGRVTLIPAVFGQVSEAGLDALLDDPNVEYVEPDLPMPLAVAASGASFRYAESTPWGVPRVTAPAAWSLGGTAAYGAGIKVAYLDSGGDSNHPDLLYAGGYNAITGSTSPSAWADDIGSCGGHGTHVGGTIAARMNDIGVVGVAPEVSLYGIKVFEDLGGSCLAYQSKQIAGLNWAVNNGIRVVSISIGGSTYNSSYESAIASASAKGVYVVASAGNNGTSTLTYPGAYSDALSVGALNSANTRSSYSNYGSKLYISAPGDGILSTLPGGNYGSKSGTSMATPHVAGVVALILARYPGITRAQLMGRLQQGALDLGAAGRDDVYGWGLSRSREAMDGTLAVPLAISVSPSTHSDSVSAGASTGHPDSAAVSLSGDNSASTAWSATARHPWTVLSTASGTGNGRLRWSRNPTGLSAGTYVDTITVNAGGLSTRILDSLRVVTVTQSAPVPLSAAVSPTSRYQSVRTGTTVQLLDSAKVVLSGTGASLAPWTAFSAKSWTTVTVAAGVGSGTVRWSRNPTNLAVGTYVDTITVVVPLAANSPRRIIDTLVVNSAPGKSKKVSRTVSNSGNSDQGLVALNDSVYVDVPAGMAWSAGTAAAWVELSREEGQGPGWLFWRRDLAGLVYGINRDSLVLSTGEGNDREAFLTVMETVVTGADEIVAEVAASALFGAGSVSSLQLQMLDLLGNANGRYDVGDFLAYFDRTGEAPSAATMARVMSLRAKSNKPR